MAGPKRRALTADDLMRMQEDGHRRKRLRIEGSDEDLDENSASEDEDVQASDEQDGEGSDSGSEDGSDGSEVSEVEDVQHAGMPSLPALADDDEDADSRFGLSRMAFKPRAALATAPNAPNPPKRLPTSFEAMGISSALVGALSKLSINAPTEIQAACIPPLLQGTFASYAAVMLPELTRMKVEIA